MPGFDRLVKEREALARPISDFDREMLTITRQVLQDGIPYLVDESKLEMVPGVHNFER